MYKEEVIITLYLQRMETVTSGQELLGRMYVLSH